MMSPGELVAVTGPSGSGKTRLLTEIAADAELAVRWFVSTLGELDTVGEPPADGPFLVLADDPTPFMSPQSAYAARRALRGLADAGHAVVAATLDPELVDLADRVVEL